MYPTDSEGWSIQCKIILYTGLSLRCQQRRWLTTCTYMYASTTHRVIYGDYIVSPKYTTNLGLVQREGMTLEIERINS